MDETHNRPEKVNRAIFLSYLAIGISALFIILQMFVNDETSLTVQFLSLFFPSWLIAYSTFLAIAYLLFLGVIYLTGQGHNWARIILLLLLIVDTLFFLSSPFDIFLYPVLTLLDLASIVLQIVAIVYLFQAESSCWFSQFNRQQDIKST